MWVNIDLGVQIVRHKYGHRFKLNKSRPNLEMRKHFFTQRLIDRWSSLDDVVAALNPSTNLKELSQLT